MQAPDRMKYWCEPCDKVIKAKGPSRCPHCGEQMRCMGDKWRGGRQGQREDWKPRDADYFPAWWIYGSMRERMKMLGQIVYDRKRGEYVYSATYTGRNRTR